MSVLGEAGLGTSCCIILLSLVAQRPSFVHVLDEDIGPKSARLSLPCAAGSRVRVETPFLFDTRAQEILLRHALSLEKRQTLVLRSSENLPCQLKT